MTVGFNSNVAVNNSVYASRNLQAPSFKGNTSGLHFKAKPDVDSFEFQHLEGKKELTTADKKEIKHQARNNATGWSIFGGGLSTLYYALRSDKTIAKKYDLDVEKDKDFIKEIRKDQVKWTLPGLLVGGGGLAAYIYSKCQDADDMTIKSEKA